MIANTHRGQAQSVELEQCESGNDTDADAIGDQARQGTQVAHFEPGVVELDVSYVRLYGAPDTAGLNAVDVVGPGQ